MYESDFIRLKAEITKAGDSVSGRHSIFVCRSHDGRRWAYVDTRRTPLNDGAEQWRRFICNASGRGYGAWNCDVTAYRGFHLTPYAGKLGVWVAIEEQVNVATGRKLALEAFVTLESPAIIRPCAYPGDEPMSDAAARMALTEGDGLVELSVSGDVVTLKHEDLIVHFDTRARRDQPMIVECWSELEVIVTS